MKNFAIAFNQGLNLQKKTPPAVSPSWSKSPSIDRRHDAACMQRRHLNLNSRKVEAQVSMWFSFSCLVQSLRAADILNFRMRALFKRPRRSSKNQTRSRPQSGRRRRNWQKRSRKIDINLKLLADGFPALMVENRFQALPETSNRRFSLAEISGTGLICDWQNF